MNKTPLIASLFIVFLNTPSFAQIGGEIAYVYGPKKEAFAGRLYFGEEFGIAMIGIGYEQGKFNSQPTGRQLAYHSVKLGGDFNPFHDWSWEANIFYPYFGVDFEYLKTTKIIDKYRVSIYPKAGFRFLKVLFVEITPDNLNEPSGEGRFFKFNYNTYRLQMGFNYYFDRGGL